MIAVALAPAPIGRSHDAARVAIDDDTFIRLADLCRNYNQLSSFLIAIIRERLPEDATRMVGKRFMRRWGWFVRENALPAVEALLEDAAIIQEAWTRFDNVRAIHHAKRYEEKITVTAAVPTSAPARALWVDKEGYQRRVTVVEATDTRRGVYEREPIRACEFSLGAGQLIGAFFDGRVFVQARGVHGLLRPDMERNDNPGKKIRDAGTNGHIYVVENRKGAKAHIFVATDHMDALVQAVFGQRLEPTAEAQKVAREIVEIADAWRLAIIASDKQVEETIEMLVAGGESPAHDQEIVEEKAEGEPEQTRDGKVRVYLDRMRAEITAEITAASERRHKEVLDAIAEQNKLLRAIAAAQLGFA